MSEPLRNKPAVTRSYKYPWRYFDAVDASIDQTGVELQLLDDSQFYASIGWTGALNGQLIFETTNDLSIGYAPLPEGSITLTGANNTNYSYNRQLWRYFRMRWVAGTGSAGILTLSLTVGHDN